MNTHKIILGDCIAGMQTLPVGCVQTCITSPPYWGLRDYGTATWEGGNVECDHSTPRSRGDDICEGDKQKTSAGSCPNKTQICLICGARRIDLQLGLEPTPDEYVANMVAVFREVKRVLRDDGTVWLNLGDSYAGFKGQSGQGNAEQQSERAARGESINQAHHQIAGKKKTRPTDDRASLRQAGLKPKDLVGIPWRVAFALQADGWYLRQDIIWHKPNPMPESVTDRCTKAHEYIFLLSKKPKYYFDNEAIKEPCKTYDHHPEYRRTRNENERIENSGKYGKTSFSVIPANGRNRRSVWTVTTKPFRGAHFATFPKDLIEPCVLAGCPVGGTVFDPFTGSGTTAVVALLNGRNYIGIELNPEYIKIAEDRIKDEVPQTLKGMFEQSDKQTQD